MAGHSKWANIKRTKAKVDEQKGKIFSKMAREIMAAARFGGPNPDANFRLRTAIQKAKEANLPAENIQRAIQKGAGGADGQQLEELVYEGYGPGGVAVMVEALTDNRNRTAAEVRHLFSKYGGNLGESGSVAWMFARKGVLEVPRAGLKLSEDDLMLLALDAGADDVRPAEGGDAEAAYEVLCPPDRTEAVRSALERGGVPVRSAEVTQVPQSVVEVGGEDAQRLLRLLEALEDHDDVQRVHANFDLSEVELQRLV